MSESNTSPVADEEPLIEGAASEAGASSPPPTPKDPVLVLEEEVASLKDQLLRRRAEFDNYRRRVERDQRAASEDAVIQVLSDLLPSLDALEKALAAAGTLAEIRKGIEITLKDLSASLMSRGMRIDDPTGGLFDPLRHQALSYEAVAGAMDGEIVTCYRKGYFLGDRLIRPALVKVAQKAPEADSTITPPASH